MRITNFNAVTPESKVVKSMFDAALTLDLSKVRPFVTKDYTFQTFPKIPNLPDEDREETFGRYRLSSSLVAKLEV